MSTHSITLNYQQLLAAIREQELISQRTPGSVKLLAVSKTHGPDRVREAWQVGARDFGENYVQEALAKMAELSAPQSATPGITWHFIGPIQSNKTRDIAAHFDWVHSVDRLKIIQRLQDQRPAGLAPLNVCVQINLSNEDTKSGVDLQQARNLCAAVAQQDKLCLRGLMAIPAPCTDPLLQRAAFRPLAALFRELQSSYPSMDTLSMGMSDDYAAAIAEGSTMIRIGTGIFGKREYPGEQS
ncbi:YggS family pyridoxal phosphate-dependent enzyme [Gammaproteobacteria bacterium LSUCC0112]|nr:YggS family pyridoxal phosphate-dependent enzyme [Gammaproteobacteria bacterium LSUCC0112]